MLLNVGTYQQLPTNCNIAQWAFQGEKQRLLKETLVMAILIKG
jgi:hypothetical protein